MVLNLKADTSSADEDQIGPVRKVNFMVNRPSLTEIEAAARVLYSEGSFHHWWPETTSTYDSLDPIGKNEFDAIVERMLMAAQKAKKS